MTLTLTGFLASVALASGVKVGIQKLGSSLLLPSFMLDMLPVDVEGPPAAADAVHGAKLLLTDYLALYHLAMAQWLHINSQ